MATWWQADPVPGFETVLCIATGPSLTIEQVALADTWRAERRGRIVAVNDAYRFVPRFDVLYACDAKWWHIHWPLAAGIKGDRPFVTIDDSVPYSDVFCLRCDADKDRDGLTDDRGALRHGSNSGYQAVHLAHHFGARRIMLLGYDFQRTEGSHCFGKHPEGLESNTPYHVCVPLIEQLIGLLADRGVSVVNLSPRSAITCETADFRQALSA